MAQVEDRPAAASGSAGFTEGFVDADGFHIRYETVGEGRPLVVLHGAGGLRRSRSHELLAEQHRVILFEEPGFGHSAENTRTQDMAEYARTMAEAASALGLDSFNLMGNSFGGRLALWLAAQFPERIQSLTLIAPAAIRLEGQAPLSPEQRARAMFAHPERLGPRPTEDPAVTARQDALLRRFAGPARDADLEDRMKSLNVPVLVLLGEEDKLIPPAVGGIYRELLPNCNVFYVYDAAHQVDVDRPEACAAVISDFTARHEGFVVTHHSGLLYP